MNVKLLIKQHIPEWHTDGALLVSLCEGKQNDTLSIHPPSRGLVI
jgi:hypothetical protein